MTLTRVLTVAALAVGLAVAAILGLLYLMGDCWAAHDTPEATRVCEINKRSGVFAYLVMASGMWLTGAVFALRGRAFAKRLGLLSGPVAFLAANPLF